MNLACSTVFIIFIVGQTVAEIELPVECGRNKVPPKSRLVALFAIKNSGDMENSVQTAASPTFEIYPSLLCLANLLLLSMAVISFLGAWPVGKSRWRSVFAWTPFFVGGFLYLCSRFDFDYTVWTGDPKGTQHGIKLISAFVFPAVIGGLAVIRVAAKRSFFRSPSKIGVVLFLLLLLLFPFPNWWETPWMQRRVVAWRVYQAGGWGALRKDCILLAQQRNGEYGRWWREDIPVLPPTITALKPMFIEICPTNGQFADVRFYSPDFPVVSFQLFGGHRTGMRDVPRLWLEVVCTPSGDSHAVPNRLPDRWAGVMNHEVAHDIYWRY